MHKRIRIFVAAAIVLGLSVFFALLPENTSAISVQCGKTAIGWKDCGQTSFNANGDASNFDGQLLIKTNTDDSGTYRAWTASGNTWIKVNHGSGLNDAKIKIWAEPNPTTKERSGGITFYEAGTSNSFYVGVTQAAGDNATAGCSNGADVCLKWGGNQVADGSGFQIEPAGGSVSFDFFSIYTIPSSTRLRLEGLEGSGSPCAGFSIGSNGRTITATANNSGTRRECLFYVDYDSGTNSGRHASHIIQNAENPVAPEPLPPGIVNDPDDSGTGDATPAPASTCNAGKFGWALCPIMEGLDEALGNIYGFIESNFLQIKIGFYDTNSETYTYWGTFRNIANIFFVVFFLIVIFSQVTSVGISNYGIKKMLPEIILAALLINLSYFICQAMVDISNIVGVSIRDLLGAIVGETNWNDVGAAGGNSFLWAVIGVSVASLAGFTAVTILTQGVFGLIFAFLLVLLAAALALLMMFVILVARQIGVILLIVIAPLAFAARILPNTQGLFKNWWKAFTTLLVVYPICSLVIGLGAAASRIIAGEAAGAAEDNITLVQGIWIAAAVLATIAPYFAVISLSKGALNGLGKLGGMISGKVQGAGAGLSKLGRTGAAAGQKKYDQSAGRQARLANAKAKMEAKQATKIASGKGIYGKLQKTQIQAAQTKSDAELANLGQYQGTDKKLQKISARRAAALGVDPTTGAATRAPKNAVEEELQAAAKTARNKADAEQSKKWADNYSEMGTDQVMDDVYDKTSGDLTTTDHNRAKQAISKLVSSGKYEQARKVINAYGNKFGSDSRAMSQMARAVRNSSPKLKDEDFGLSDYLKRLDENKDNVLTTAGGKTLANYEASQGAGSGAFAGHGLREAANDSKYHLNNIDMDAINSLAAADTGPNAGELRAAMLGRMGLEDVLKLDEGRLNALKAGATGNADWMTAAQKQIDAFDGLSADDQNRFIANYGNAVNALRNLNTP
ncbi:MAG: hypothetical protein LBM12_02090 [Candidatus Nomurabacteria bacterium]|jgi:hypothetical protein|nr:hypothetical protein [Candidatus Nomurabacteria bacterium]